MGRLDTAITRLSTALDALTVRAAEAGAEVARIEPARTESEAAELRAERDRLMARLAELEEQSHTLAGVTGEVEARLDEAIAEIREVLERAA